MEVRYSVSRVDQKCLSYNSDKWEFLFIQFHTIPYVEKIVWNLYNNHFPTNGNCMIGDFSIEQKVWFILKFWFQIIRHWSRYTKTRHTKEIGIFSVFWKKIKWKKKAIIIVSRTTLCTQKLNFACKKFFFGRCLLAYKIRFAVKKTKKSFARSFQNY